MYLTLQYFVEGMGFVDIGVKLQDLLYGCFVSYTRNPNIEIRNKPKILNPNVLNGSLGLCFGFRDSDFFLAFGR